MARVLHPVFSSDLALSDVYFFGRVKATLKRFSFENENEDEFLHM
jgi:hypothetical protein